MDSVTSAVLILGVVCLIVLAIGGFLIIGLIRGLYELRQRVDALADERKRAPEFLAYDLAGQRMSSFELLGQPYGLLFVTPFSDASENAIANLASIRDRTGDNLIIVCRGLQANCQDFLGSVGPDTRTVLDAEGDLHRLFQIEVVPTILVIDEAHRIKTEGKIVPPDDVDALTQQFTPVGVREE